MGDGLQWFYKVGEGILTAWIMYTIFREGKRRVLRSYGQSELISVLAGLPNVLPTTRQGCLKARKEEAETQKLGCAVPVGNTL